MQFTGKGLLGFNKSSGKFTSGLLDLTKTFKNFVFDAFSEKSFGDGIMQSLFRGVSRSTNLNDFIFNLSEDQFNALPDSFINWFDSLDKGKQKVATVGDALEALGTRVFSLGNLFSNLGSITLKVFSTLGTMAIVAGVAAGITALATAIYNAVTEEERAIKAGEEAQKQIESINNAYEDTEKKTKELGERYNELRGGVSYKEGKGYINQTLSEDEFAEFLSINQQLSDLFPELRAGIDSQGNAYVNLGDDADKATAALKEYLQVQREIADEEIGAQFETQLEGVLAKTKKAGEEKYFNDQNISKNAANIQAAQQGIESFITKVGDNSYTLEINTTQDADNKIQNAFLETLWNYNDQHIVPEQWQKAPTISEDGNYTYSVDVVYEFEIDEASLKGVEDQVNEAIGHQRESFEETSKAEKNNIKIDRQVRDDWDSLRYSLLKSISGQTTYKDLSEAYQTMISEAISNVDLQREYEKFEAFKLTDEYDNEDFQTYFNKKYLYDVADTILDASDQIDEAQQELWDQLINFDGSDLSNKGYQNQIDSIVEQITQDEEVQKTIKIILNYMYEDENGDAKWTVNKQKNDLFEAIGGEIVVDENGKKKHVAGENGITWEQFKKLTVGQMEALEYAQSNMGVNLENIAGYKELLGIIQDTEEEMYKTQDIAKDGTLADLLGDETYTANVENWEKDLSTVDTALQTLRDEGHLAQDAKKELIEAFSGYDIDWDNITGADLSDIGTDKLKEWIAAIKDAKELMTPEEAKKADAYTKSILRSYENMFDEMYDIKSLYLEMNIDPTDAMSSKYVSERFDYQLQLLQSQLPENEELDFEVVAALIATDQFSGTADEILEKYRNMKVEIEITAKDKALQDIQRNLEYYQAEKGSISADNNYVETSGNILTREQYENIGEAIANEVEQNVDAEGIYEKEYRDAETKLSQNPLLKENYTAYQKAGTDYQNAHATRVNSEIEQLQNVIDQYQSESRQLDAQLQLLENNAKEIQNGIDQREEIGLSATEGQYRRLIANAQEQMDLIDQQIDAKRQEAYDFANDERFGINSQYYRDAMASVNDLIAQQNTLNNSVREWKEMISTGLELENLGRELSDIESEATQIQDDMNLFDSKGLKADVKTYKLLLDNSEKQIKNIRQQNRLLDTQRKHLVDIYGEEVKNSDKYRDITNQIDSNRSAIRQLQQDQIDYNNQIRTFEVTDAQTLFSNLQTALSETITSTGLTVDTIVALKKSFSDLAGVDTSTIFYRTADGIKLDTNAVYNLIQRENELKNNSFAQSINEKRQEIEDYKNSTENIDLSHLHSLQDELIELLQMQSKYFATYQDQLAQLNQHSMIELADQTENAGDKARKAKSYIESAYEAWDKGLIGTDDFKERAAYFDYYGRTDAATFKANYDKFKGFYTDDASGLKKFYDYLVDVGVLSKDAEGNYQSLTSSANDAAKAAGMSLQAYTDLMNLSREYGFEFTSVTSIEDAEEQIAGLSSELRNARSELIELEAQGADQTIIDQKQAEIDQIQNRMRSIESQKTEIENIAENINKTELPNLASEWKQMREFRNEAIKEGDLESQRYWEEQMESKAHEFNLKITPKYEFDRKGWQELMDEAFPSPDEVIQGAKQRVVIAGKRGNIQDIKDAQQYVDILETINKESQDTNSSMASQFETLKNASSAAFDAIIFGDGQVAEGFEAEEAALDNLLSQLGLGQEAGAMLVSALAALGLIDYEPTINTDSVDEADDKVNQLQEDVEKPAEKTIKVALEEESQQTSDTSAHAQMERDAAAARAHEMQQQEEYSQKQADQQPTISAIEQVEGVINDANSKLSDIASGIGTLASDIGSAVMKAFSEKETKTGNETPDYTGTPAEPYTKMQLGYQEQIDGYQELLDTTEEPISIEINTESAEAALASVDDTLQEMIDKAGNIELKFTTGNNGEGESVIESTGVSDGDLLGDVTNQEVTQEVIFDPNTNEFDDTVSRYESKKIEVEAVLKFNETESQQAATKPVSVFSFGNSGASQSSTPAPTQVQAVETETRNTNVNKDVTVKQVNYSQNGASDVADAANTVSEAVNNVPEEHNVNITETDNDAAGKADNISRAVTSIPTSWTSTITGSLTPSDIVDKLTNLYNIIQKLQSKEITVRTTYSTVNKPNGDSGGPQGQLPSVNGTANAWGTAYALGNATDDDLRRVAGISKAKGDWGNKNPGRTLVGELGTEIVVFGIMPPYVVTHMKKSI